MNNRAVRATASRLTRRTAPTRTLLRSAAMYDNAADVPADLPGGSDISLPANAPPPPGFTEIDGSDADQDEPG